MRFTLTALALCAMGAHALVMEKRDGYANFFDDSACSENGGIGVDMTNTGCLSEGGRGSVYIPNDGSASFTLRKFHDASDCSGDSDDWQFTATGKCDTSKMSPLIKTGFCAVLDPNDQSYLFIRSGGL